MTIKRQLRLRDSTVLGDDDAVPPKPLDRGGREGEPRSFFFHRRHRPNRQEATATKAIEVASAVRLDVSNPNHLAAR